MLFSPYVQVVYELRTTETAGFINPPSSWLARLELGPAWGVGAGEELAFITWCTVRELRVRYHTILYTVDGDKSSCHTHVISVFFHDEIGEIFYPFFLCDDEVKPSREREKCLKPCVEGFPPDFQKPPTPKKAGARDAWWTHIDGAAPYVLLALPCVAER